MSTREQQFTQGWLAADRDDFSGKGERKIFTAWISGAWIEGYTAWFDKQRLEVETAERECRADYDQGPAIARERLQ